MNTAYSNSGTSVKIWLYTNGFFGIGWAIVQLILQHAALALTAPIAAIISSVANSPILVVLLIVLPFISRSTLLLMEKKLLLYLVLLMAIIPYGILTGEILPEEFRLLPFAAKWLYWLTCTLILFALAMLACYLLNTRINYIFTINQHINNMEQDTNYPTPNPLPQAPTESNGQSGKILLKGTITGALILLLMIPVLFVTKLVEEREKRQQEVTYEISSKWAAPQTLGGPYLYLPYSVKLKDDKGAIISVEKELFILPENLNVTGTITPEIRPRSIYKVLLYKSNLVTTGNFVLQLPRDITADMVNFAEARICYTLRDFKGIEQKLVVKLNDNSYELSPGLPYEQKEYISKTNAGSSSAEIDRAITVSDNQLAVKGLSANINITAAQIGQSIQFSLAGKINGSEQLHFLPMAGNSSYHISSIWPDPKFDGNNLPTTRQVTATGFEAKWNFNKANLPFGTVLKDFKFDKQPYAFGVSMVQPADHYAKTMRSVKYAILFIGLSFALFFVVELMQKKPLHPVQYLLIGLALVIFYTLLLAISEFIHFDYAYAVAAVATISLITIYTGAHFKSGKTAALFGSILSMLYGFIFVLIRLEDTALLVGSIGLFVILAIVMFASRKINWYGSAKTA
jgi:inner membrane protein